MSDNNTIITIKDRFIPANLVSQAGGMNLWLFGEPGVGKTTLAATCADSDYGKDVLFIAVEAGTKSIEDRPEIDVFTPSGMADISEVFEFLSDEQHKYKTVVLDTMNELQMLGLATFTNTFPDLQDWGKSTDQIRRLMRAFIGLARDNAMNVIFISHAAKIKDDVLGKIYTRPNLTPKAAESAEALVDMMGYLSMDDNGKRNLRLSPTNTITAKYRQPRTGIQLPPVIENPSMVTILEHMKGGKPIAQE